MLEAAPIAGPPNVRVQIGEAEYRLSLDLGDLARAELWHRAQGSPCNLVTSIPIVTEQAYATVELLACALRAHHPEISFDRATQLVSQGRRELIATTLDRSWAAASAETLEANRKLCFNLDALARASEIFAAMGSRVSVVASPISLAAVRSIFPCALYEHRPDLTFSAARQLMDVRSVYAVDKGFSDSWRTASPATRERFSARFGQRNRTGIAHA